jgi:hypothetical protein
LLESDKVGEALSQLDSCLTPNQGSLHRWRKTDGGKKAKAWASGRILLLLHGAFSNSEHMVAQIRSSRHGAEFFERAVDRYTQVLTLDHATLAVNPFLNAIDLERLFEGSDTTIDLVCHGRAGLVARWWIEVVSKRRDRFGRVVFAGSPLAGTSLASPGRLRDAIDFLTNVLAAVRSDVHFEPNPGAVLSVIASLSRIAIPFTQPVAGVAAKHLAIDAGAALVPGFSAQSPAANNEQLLRLRRAIPGDGPEYYAVQSHFEPELPGWQFWRYFNQTGVRRSDSLASPIFEGPNDLLVDYGSTTDLSEGSVIAGTDTRNAPRVKDFGKNSRVHHFNYFQDQRTIQHLANALELR